MVTEKCESCGARLPVAAPGGVVRCSFCGAERRVGGVPLQPWGVPPSAGGFPQGAPIKVSPLLYVLPFGLVLFGVAFSMLMAHRAQREAEARALEVTKAVEAHQVAATGALQAGTPASPGKRALELSELATTPFTGWEAVNAPGMVGTLDAFDAIANMPWAMKIAQAWVPDARLHRVDFGRVEKSGQVNLRTIPDAKSGYRFVSPSRAAEYVNSTALVDPKIVTEFEVEVSKDGVRVLEYSSKPFRDEPDPAVAPPACTLGQAFAAIEKAGKLPPRPAYTGYLIDVQAGKRPLYYLNTLTGSPSIPRVNALNCKLQ